VVSSTTETQGDDGVVRLRTIWAALRHHARLLAVCGVAGLLLGVGVHLALPRKVTATEDLYVVEPPASNVPVAIADDQSVLQTRAVAAAAMQRLHLRGRPAVFLRSYTSTVVSDAVISVSLKAATPRDALTRAQALATAFLDFRAQQYTEQVDGEVADLDGQIGTLDGAIAQLAHAVSTGSGAHSTTGGSPSLTSLIDEEDSDSSAVTTLREEISAAQLGLRTMVAGSKLLDPPVVSGPSNLHVAAEDGLSGLIAAIGLAALAIAVVTSISAVVIWRDEVAEALGVPVVASVGRRRRLRRRRGANPARDPMEVAASLWSGPTSSTLSVVAVGNGRTERDAAALIAHFAQSCAMKGTRVGVVDLTSHGWLADRLGLKGEHDRRDFGRGSIRLVSDRVPGPGEKRPAAITSGELLLQLLTVDPGLGSEYLAPLASPAVIVTRAGSVTAAQLRTSAVLLRRAGFDLGGAVLVDADQRDSSVGDPSAFWLEFTSGWLTVAGSHP